MDSDIIIYAVIAVIVFAKLWSVLGRRNEGDAAKDPNATPRFNPFAPKPVSEEEDEAPFRLEGKSKVALPAPHGNVGNSTVQGMPPVISALPPLRAAPMSLLGKLEAVKQLDPAFDERAFLTIARQAFTTILAEFAAGDLTEALPHLGATVLTHFQAAIDARKAAGQTLENTLVRMRDAEVADAAIDGTRATLTVRFASDQKNILRDGAGNIVDGDGRVEEIVDKWNFSRDMAQLSSTWILVETKS